MIQYPPSPIAGLAGCGFMAWLVILAPIVPAVLQFALQRAAVYS